MRAIRSNAAHVAAGILIAWLVASCGATAREKTISATFAATDSARASFVVFDLDRQHAILAAATDKPTADSELAKYRAEQIKIEQLFAGVYRAIAAASAVNDQPSLSGLTQAALILSDELHALGVLK